MALRNLKRMLDIREQTRASLTAVTEGVSYTNPQAINSAIVCSGVWEVTESVYILGITTEG